MVKIMKRNLVQIIDDLNVNEVKTFKISDDEKTVVMVMNNDEEIVFSVSTGFEIFYFYQLTEKISGKKVPFKNAYISIEGYVRHANAALFKNELRNVITSLGSDACVDAVQSIMVDAFKKTNLIELAKKENNLSKYVAIAIELLNELDGDVNIIYTNKFRQRTLKVGE